LEGKRKRPPSPPSEDFGDSKISEEEFSSGDYGSPTLASFAVAFDDSDNSMGLSVAERAYIRSIKCTWLEGSDDSGEDSSENSLEEEDSEVGGNNGDEGDNYVEGDGDGDDGDGDGGERDGDDGDGGERDGDDGEGDKMRGVTKRGVTKRWIRRGVTKRWIRLSGLAGS
jgi:hypothetical protein